MNYTIAIVLWVVLTVANAQDRVSWVLAYYMCYDNNLSIYKSHIIEELRKGTIQNDVRVTILSDEPQTDNLEFHEVTVGTVKTRPLSHDNSASNLTFHYYVREVTQLYPAESYAIVLLNHGGRLDQMCLDENPGEDSNMQWLSSLEVGESLRLINNELDKKIKLVFLQQCGRATIESLYNFRGAGKLIMASPFNVGAPNTYYARTLEWLGRTPTATASALATKIAETDNHYRLYTTIDGNALSQLPKYINGYLKNLRPDVGRSLLHGLTYSSQFLGEKYFDIGKVLIRLTSHSSHSEVLKRWIQETLIKNVYVRSGSSSNIGDRVGLNMFIPNDQAALLRYSDYPFYHTTMLDEFLQLELGDIPVATNRDKSQERSQP